MKTDHKANTYGNTPGPTVRLQAHQCSARILLSHLPNDALQAFHLHTQFFFKFLLLRFTTHFGSEPICAVNTFRAFGISEAEDLEEQLSALQGSGFEGTHRQPIPASAVVSTPVIHTQDSSSFPSSASTVEVGKGYEHASAASESGPCQAAEQPHCALADTQATTSTGISKNVAEAVHEDSATQHHVNADDGFNQRILVARSSNWQRSMGESQHSGLEADHVQGQGSSAGSHSPTQTELTAGVVSSKTVSDPMVLPHVFNEAVGVIVHGYTASAERVHNVVHGGNGEATDVKAHLRTQYYAADCQSSAVSDSVACRLPYVTEPENLGKEVSQLGHGMGIGVGFYQSIILMQCPWKPSAGNISLHELFSNEKGTKCVDKASPGVRHAHISAVEAQLDMLSATLPEQKHQVGKAHIVEASEEISLPGPRTPGVHQPVQEDGTQIAASQHLPKIHLSDGGLLLS